MKSQKLHFIYNSTWFNRLIRCKHQVKPKYFPVPYSRKSLPFSNSRMLRRPFRTLEVPLRPSPKRARSSRHQTWHWLRLSRRVRLLPPPHRLHTLLCLRVWRRTTRVLHWWPYVQVRNFHHHHNLHHHHYNHKPNVGCYLYHGMHHYAPTVCLILNPNTVEHPCWMFCDAGWLA